jgi:hypothetical protein
MAAGQARTADKNMIENSSTVKPLRVLYIAGYGRSGTTLLDIALGQHAAIAGAGEIATLSRHVWSHNEYCSCGQPASDCPLWGPIGRQWSGSFPLPSSIVDYKREQENIESILGFRRILRRTLTRRSFQSYAEKTFRLFEAIKHHSGKEIIVDSSKLPGRALALTSIPGIDLFVVHLVRDGRGVAWSLLQSYKRDVKAGVQKEIRPKSALRTAARWCVVNVATEALRWKLGRGRYIRVKYEDLVVDPVPTLERIGEMIDLDLADIALKLQGGEPIQPTHQIAGNRLRMNKSIRLVGDEAWRTHLPARERAAFDRLGGWLLRRYGYAR